MDKEQAIAWLVSAYLSECEQSYFIDGALAEQAALALNTLTTDHWIVRFKQESHGPTWHLVKL